MKFNEGNAEKYGGKKEFNIKCKSFINNPNFAYSLYHYLKEVRVINDKFSPVRYDGKDLALIQAISTLFDYSFA